MFSGGDVFGTVHEVKRLRNTRDGNARWSLVVDEHVIDTSPDSAFASCITPDLVGQRVRLIMAGGMAVGIEVKIDQQQPNGK